MHLDWKTLSRHLKKNTYIHLDNLLVLILWKLTIVLQNLKINEVQYKCHTKWTAKTFKCKKEHVPKAFLHKKTLQTLTMMTSVCETPDSSTAVICSAAWPEFDPEISAPSSTVTTSDVPPMTLYSILAPPSLQGEVRNKMNNTGLCQGLWVIEKTLFSSFLQTSP